MASPPLPRLALVILACAAPLGCGSAAAPGDDEVGASETEGSDASTGSDQGEGESTTGADESDTTSTGESSETETSETETSETETSETESETDTSETDTSETETTGEPEACVDQLVGEGIADDGWGPGFCDALWLCVPADQVAAVEATLPGFTCGFTEIEGFQCPEGEQQCAPGDGDAQVDPALYDQLCAALELPGVDAAHCLIWGP